jgi:hypothetical protein
MRVASRYRQFQQYYHTLQQRVVILLKMLIRTFINAPGSPTKDWPARNNKTNIANTAGVRHHQFWAESHLAESFSIWLKC